MLFATALLAACACALPGIYLVPKRLSLTGDAIAHSVLPGVVLGFLVTGTLHSAWLALGAAASGLAAVHLATWLQKRGAMREDAALGVVFTTLFAFGLVLVRIYGSRLDLDPECVFFGNLETSVLHLQGHVPPYTVQAAVIFALNAGFFLTVSRALGASCFDGQHFQLMGRKGTLLEHLALALTALTVVTTFQAVGVLMTLALLVLPAASAWALGVAYRHFALATLGHAIVATASGYGLARLGDVNLGASIVLAGGVLLVLACMLRQGATRLLWQNEV